MVSTRAVLVAAALLAALLVTVAAPMLEASSVDERAKLEAKARAAQLLLERLSESVKLPDELRDKIDAILAVNVSEANTTTLEWIVSEAHRVFTEVRQLLNTTGEEAGVVLERLKTVVLERLEMISERLGIRIPDDVKARIVKASSLEELFEATTEAHEEILEAAAEHALNATVEVLEGTRVEEKALRATYRVVSKAVAVLERVYKLLEERGASPEAIEAVRTALQHLIKAKEALANVTINATGGALNETRLAERILEEIGELRDELHELKDRYPNVTAIDRLLERLDRLEKSVLEKGVTAATLAELREIKVKVKLLERTLDRIDELREEISELRAKIEELRAKLNATDAPERYRARIQQLLDHAEHLLMKAEDELERGAVLAAAELIGRAREALKLAEKLLEKVERISEELDELRKELEELQAKLQDIRAKLEQVIDEVPERVAKMLERMLSKAESMLGDAQRLIEEGKAVEAKKLLAAAHRLVDRLEDALDHALNHIEHHKEHHEEHHKEHD
ncbi:hypothetical protein Pyrfu_0738 [Pyrolobus fumarii 1A]|uniref:Uncharacterized protein n=2 Tax=Pyrolobus fumarii TaxID=54252 RepID=G0EDC2_PYRF1|nr:hypothetical protein Pyrfu_0738 [Pyrolobus fumarii 1A]